MSNAYALCEIDNKSCSCQLIGIKYIIKLDCFENTNQDFMQNLTKIKQEYDFSQMIELKVKNKLIRNISNSNIGNLRTLQLRRLSITECKIQSISKGIFNLMLNLMKLDLSKNKIETIETHSFSVEPFQSNLLELRLSENKLTKIKQGQFNGLISLEILFLNKNQIGEIEMKSFDFLSNKIKTIYLSENRLKEINAAQLNGLFKLEELYLEKNELTAIADKQVRI